MEAMVRIRSFDNMSVSKAFGVIGADIMAFTLKAYLTRQEKYRTICNFRALCHKVRESAKYEKQIKEIVLERGVEWVDEDIELSVHKALCATIPDEFRNTSSFKRYLYDTPRIIRVIDEKGVPLKDTYEYLKEHGIDKLANNRGNKSIEIETSVNVKLPKQISKKLQDCKSKCEDLSDFIDDLLREEDYV